MYKLIMKNSQKSIIFVYWSITPLLHGHPFFKSHFMGLTLALVFKPAFIFACLFTGIWT